jgi:hypothetical protein
VSGLHGYCPSRRRRHDHTAAKQPSDEVDENRLPMARTQGSSYHDAVGYVATTVASTGGTQSAGDYVVGFVQARPRGRTNSSRRASSSGGSPTARTATSR